MLLSFIGNIYDDVRLSNRPPVNNRKNIL